MYISMRAMELMISIQNILQAPYNLNARPVNFDFMSCSTAHLRCMHMVML